MPRTLPSQAIKTIERFFPTSVRGDGRRQAVSGMPDITFKFQAILDLVEHIPSELMTLKDEEYARFSAGVTSLRWGLQHPVEHGRGLVVALYPIPEFDGANPIALIFDMLGKCPDEFPSANTSELTFIEDADFRQGLRNDLSAISRALANSEWKATTVLAGSVVESLLLWKLDKDQAKAMVTRHAISKKLPSTVHWNLSDYIEVALELKLIGERSAIQARLAKDFRNLIHPGRSIRLGEACNRGTAFGAVAAVELVIEDLSR